MMLKKFITIFGLIILSACQGNPGIVRDTHTGKVIVHSQQFSANSGLLFNLNAVAGWTSTGGYSVTIEHMNTGGNWQFFREAWSYGKRYNYAVTNEKVLGCAAGCTFYETGSILMSEADFKAAATRGFAFKVVGKGGAVEGSIPAKAFQQVLNQMGSR